MDCLMDCIYLALHPVFMTLQFTFKSHHSHRVLCPLLKEQLTCTHIQLGVKYLTHGCIDMLTASNPQLSIERKPNYLTAAIAPIQGGRLLKSLDPL